MGMFNIWKRFRSSRKSNCKINSKLVKAVQGLFEPLERRQLMSLLGVTPGYPSLPLDTDTSVMNYTHNPTSKQGLLTAAGRIPSPVAIRPRVNGPIFGRFFPDK